MIVIKIVIAILNFAFGTMLCCLSNVKQIRRRKRELFQLQIGDKISEQWINKKTMSDSERYICYFPNYRSLLGKCCTISWLYGRDLRPSVPVFTLIMARNVPTNTWKVITELLKQRSSTLIYNVIGKDLFILTNMASAPFLSLAAS